MELDYSLIAKDLQSVNYDCDAYGNAFRKTEHYMTCSRCPLCNECDKSRSGYPKNTLIEHFKKYFIKEKLEALLE